MITFNVTAASGKTKILILEIIAASFILLFVYAAASKLIDHAGFLHSLQNSPLLQSFAKSLSWLVPFTEIAISILLFSPKLKKAGLLFSVFLMTAFTFYIAYMLLFIPHLPCSCGGALKNMTWTQHLIFNIVITMLGIIGWRISKSNEDVIAINRASRTPV